MRGAASSSGASAAHSRQVRLHWSAASFHMWFSSCVLASSGFGGGAVITGAGGGAAQAASPARIAPAIRMRKSLDICESSLSALARAAPGGRIAESRDSINSAQLIEHQSRPTWCAIGFWLRSFPHSEPPALGLRGAALSATLRARRSWRAITPRRQLPWRVAQPAKFRHGPRPELRGNQRDDAAWRRAQARSAAPRGRPRCVAPNRRGIGRRRYAPPRPRDRATRPPSPRD
jgi:hypothetical protein